MKQARPEPMRADHSTGNETERLALDELIERFKKDPGSVQFPIGGFQRCFELTDAELLEELRSGRLIAQGEPDGVGGYRNIAIKGDHAVAWLAQRNRDAPQSPMPELYRH